jgi:hypothetical protein
MIRSLSFLRRGILGIVFAGSLSFGAATALAGPPVPAFVPTCNPGDVGANEFCNEWCGSRGGYCNQFQGICNCYPIIFPS